MCCARLKPIVQLPNRNRTGELDYGPVDHEQPETHGGCGGTITWDEHPGEQSRVFESFAICEYCGEVDGDSVVAGAARCPGVRKAIR